MTFRWSKLGVDDLNCTLGELIWILDYLICIREWVRSSNYFRWTNDILGNLNKFFSILDYLKQKLGNTLGNLKRKKI